MYSIVYKVNPKELVRVSSWSSLTSLPSFCQSFSMCFGSFIPRFGSRNVIDSSSVCWVGFFSSLMTPRPRVPLTPVLLGVVGFVRRPRVVSLHISKRKREDVILLGFRERPRPKEKIDSPSIGGQISIGNE